MTTINKILVPFDHSGKSLRALNYAAMFASGIGASITALHLADPKDYESKAAFEKELADMVSRELKPKLSEIQLAYPDVRKIDLQIRGLEKSVAEHVVTFANEHAIDCIVMRSHGLPNLDDWELQFRSSNAYRVVLEARCPVFTFTQIPAQPRMRHILLPLDLSEGSLFKVPIALSLARRFGSTIHLLSGSEHHEDHEQLHQQLEEVQAMLAAEQVNTVLGKVQGATLPTAIFNYCERVEIDLVVVMSRPGFRWSDLWVSPKAKRIICHSKVPVLSIRSDRPLEVDL